MEKEKGEEEEEEEEEEERWSRVKKSETNILSKACSRFKIRLN